MGYNRQPINSDSWPYKGAYPFRFFSAPRTLSPCSTLFPYPFIPPPPLIPLSLPFRFLVQGLFCTQLIKVRWNISVSDILLVDYDVRLYKQTIIEFLSLIVWLKQWDLIRTGRQEAFSNKLIVSTCQNQNDLEYFVDLMFVV